MDNGTDERSNRQYIHGKNSYKWRKTPFPNSPTRQRNLISRLHLPGLTVAAGVVTSNEPIDFWNILIDDDIFQTIVTWANEKIKELPSNYIGSCTFVNHRDNVEI